MRRLVLMLSAIAGLLAISSCGGSSNSGGGGFAPPTTPPPPPTEVSVSGTVSSVNGFVANGGVRSLALSNPGFDTEQATTTTDNAGVYSLTLDPSQIVYVEFTGSGLATTNSALFSLNRSLAAVDITMLTTSEAQQQIDIAFPGNGLILGSLGWLVINVLDASGNEAHAVTINVDPTPLGGGTTLCSGIFSGTNVTVADPPCNPVRPGPMYLAFFDRNTEVLISISGAPSEINAPVRDGEITYLESSGSSPPPTGGTGTGTISLEVEAGGSVTSSPNLGTCTGSSTCTVDVPRGTSITLEAVADPGNHFEEWDGCNSVNGMTCTIVVDNPQIFLRAEFDPN